MDNTPYPNMTDEQLRAAWKYWDNACAQAAGWPSAYFSAKQIKAICDVAALRGIDLLNNYQIKVE